MPTKSMMVLKDLYISQTLDQLFKKADEGINRTSNAKSLMTSLAKLYGAAKKSFLEGDEERAFILYYRFFTNISLAKKCSDYKKDEKFYNDMYSNLQIKEVLDSLEVLQSSLKDRYDAHKVANELNAKEVVNESQDVSINSNSNHTNDLAKPKPIESNSKGDYPLISCLDLVESLENTTEMNKILVLDTRAAEEYNDSHMDKLRTSADITIVNIPQHLLVPGLTPSKLETGLPFGITKDVFSRRRSMSKVVIVDQHSQEVIPNTPAYHLAEALNTWDYTSFKMKNKPFLLKGGYAEWVLTYPMFTTNPNYNINKMPVKPIKTIQLAFDYDLSEFDDKPKKPDNQMVNGFTNGDIEGDGQPQAEPLNRVNNIFTTRPTNVAIPGTAKPLIPDRSKKPTIQTEINTSSDHKVEAKEDFEKIRLRKQNEISEQMLSDVRVEYEDMIESMKKQLIIKDQEKNHLIETVRKVKPKNLMANNETDSKPDDNPMIAINGDMNGTNKRNGFYLKVDESGDDKENDNLTANNMRNKTAINGDISGHQIVNPITSAQKGMTKSSNTLSVTSNLSRSLSSPNIAQLLEREMYGRHMDSIDPSEARLATSFPQFDRNLKPSFNREISKYNFYDSTLIDNKPRDFCPVNSSGPSITGLRNLGNTCFSNAVIQCLLNTTEFSSFFGGNFKINKNSKFGSNGELVLELAALFRQMAYPSSYKMLSAKDFRQAVSKHIQGFVAGAQQDSHEFLVKLFEKLHEDLNESMAKDVINTAVSEELSLNVAANKFWKEHIQKNNSIITQLFEGLIVNTLTCLTCHKTSNSFEVFSCLSLPLSNNRTTLTECLNQYFKPERMSGETAWECPTCKQKREADKKVNLWKLPKVLIVHLKRFSYEGRWKLSTYVEFPIDNLPMRTLQTQSPYHYSLYGVVNHYGTLEGGHYTAFSQNHNKYKWHRFDDQEITQINSAEVKSQAAYILFYRLQL